MGAITANRPRGNLFLVCFLALAFLASCSGGSAHDLAELESARPEDRVAGLDRLSGRPELLDLPRLRRAASDPSPLVRQAAIRIAGARGETAIDLLGGLLDDPEAGVRRAAVEALGRSDSPRAHAHLVAAYAKRSVLGREAILAMVRQRGGTADEVIRAEAKTLWERNLHGLERGGVAEMAGALEELGRSGRVEAVQRLESLLDGASIRIATTAARGLGESRDPAARPGLEKLLEAGVPALREAAAEALGKLGDPAAIPALAAVAAKAGAEGLLAAKALVRLDTLGAASCGAALLAKNPAAAQALARHVKATSSPCDASPLTKRLEEGDSVRAVAQVAKELGSKALVEPLLALAMTDETPLDRRLAVLDALGTLGGSEVRQQLRALFEPWAEALVEGRPKWVAGDLPLSFAEGFEPAGDGKGRAAGSPQELVPDVSMELELLFAAGAAALLDKGEASLKETLLGLVKDPSPAVRGVAIRGAGLGAAALLDVASGDPSWEVRQEAVEALGRLKGEEAGVALLELARKTMGNLQQICIRLLEERGDKKALLTLFSWARLPEVGAALGRLGEAEAAKALLVRSDAAPALVTSSWLLALEGRTLPEASQALHRHLHHDIPEIRAAAATVLGRRCETAPLPLLEALAREDYYVEVRLAAGKALEKLRAQCPTQL